MKDINIRRYSKFLKISIGFLGVVVSPLVFWFAYKIIEKILLLIKIALYFAFENKKYIDILKNKKIILVEGGNGNGKERDEKE